MTPLHRILLKAKHWQLFVITFAIPVVAMFIFMTLVFINILSIEQNPELFLNSFTNNIAWYMSLSLVCGIVIYLWRLAIGLEIRKLAPAETRLKTGFFIFSVALPIIFSIIFTLGYIYYMNYLFTNLTISMQDPNALPPNAGKMLIACGVMILSSIFIIFCEIYSLYFIAKTYKSAELQKNAKFEDYVAEFFLFLFSFIGVWVLQSKINLMADQIIEAEKTNTALSGGNDEK